MGGLSPMCPVKHVQSWGSLWEQKGWVGGVTQSSTTPINQGLNFPFLFFVIFFLQPRTREQRQDETARVLLQSPPNPHPPSGWKQEDESQDRKQLHGKSIIVKNIGAASTQMLQLQKCCRISKGPPHVERFFPNSKQR